MIEDLRKGNYVIIENERKVGVSISIKVSNHKFIKKLAEDNDILFSHIIDFLIDNFKLNENRK